MCSLLQPDEVRTFVEANREAVLSFPSTSEITDVGAGAPDASAAVSGEACSWEVSGLVYADQQRCMAAEGGTAEECPPGTFRTPFRIAVSQRSTKSCLVEADGRCVYLPSRRTDAPDPVMPPALVAVVQERLRG